MLSVHCRKDRFLEILLEAAWLGQNSIDLTNRRPGGRRLYGLCQALGGSAL